MNSLFLCLRQNFNLKASIDLFKKSALQARSWGGEPGGGSAPPLGNKIEIMPPLIIW